MRRSIATVTLSGTLQEKLYAIAAAKFDAVEIFENELAYFDGSPEEIRELVGQLGLEISLYQPVFDAEGVPDEVFKVNLERAERKFDLMARLGAPMMLLSSNTSRAALDDEERAAAQLRALAERAAARGLRVAYEPVIWGAHVRTFRDGARLVGKADHPALGMILDSFHTLALGEDPGAFDGLPAEKMFLLQLSDVPRLDTNLVDAGRHLRCLPGQGSLDVVGFTAAALDAGYRGPLSIEVFNDDLRAAPTRQTAAEAMRALEYVEEGVRARGAASADIVGLFDPPPPPEIEGVAFVEFAVDPGAAAELVDWLSGLGFTRVGRHRTKAVELYQNGEALLVLNASLDSFAHAYRHLYGPSVCAIGLRVADTERLLQRADAYAYRRHIEQIGPGENMMPAVRAPDGSLLQLVDSGYDPWHDFVREEQAADAGQLSGFDHVGRAVPSARYEFWALYLRVLLGLAPDETVDLPDPNGVVHSRAFANTSRTLRLPLTFSDSARTMVARSLSSFAGAGVNQIAFSTDDIFATVDAMRRRGARLLPIPANYYVELAIDSGLPGETVEALRSHQILYDRDENGGGFFHAYTETFQDRFFFEIVQRVGGYNGYGAANAPVRMAAQARRRRATSMEDVRNAQ